jgi:hypothetical protein
LTRLLGKRTLALYGDGEEEEKGPRGGRPAALNKIELLHRRDTLQGIFEAHWPSIGWDLSVARTVMGIAQAFRPLANFKHPLIDLLLLDSSARHRSDGFGALRHECKTLYHQLEEGQDRLNAANLSAVEARSALDQAHSLYAAARDSYSLARKTQKKREAKLFAKEREDWSSKCRNLLEELHRREEGISRCAEEIRGIEEKTRIAESQFAQTELLRFLKSRRYAFTAANVANAAAGLPQLGCRRSFSLCSREKCTAKQSINYTVFEAVSEILTKHTPKGGGEAAMEIRRQISTHRQFASLKPFLSDYWQALENATRMVWDSPAHPKSRAFQITALFLRSLKSTRPSINPLLDGPSTRLHPKL